MICRFMKRIALAAFLFVTLVLSAAEPAPTLRRNTVDETFIPTGIEPVEGTPMDLRKSVVVGADIDNPFTQLVYGGGYDHNWILNAAGDINKVAAKVVSPTSGIVMEVYTNEPGLQ